VSWLALLFGGALKKLWAIVSHASFAQIVAGVLTIVIVAQHFELKRSRAEAAKWHRQYDGEHAGREADRNAYVKAQADAAAKNKAQIQQIEQQQQKVTDDVEARYRADHARLLAGGVQPANPAPASPTSKPGAPTPGAAPGGPDGQAVPLSGPELLRAQETELQLNALIDWVLQQSQIDPNTEAPAK
jgi:hypothetical protein